MDLDRTEVSDTSESSLHCTICNTMPQLSSRACTVLCCLCPVLHGWKVTWVTDKWWTAGSLVVRWLVCPSLSIRTSLTLPHTIPPRATYQWATGSQLCMYPVCQSDGLFDSFGCGTPSACPHTCTYTRTPVSSSCHSMVMLYMHGLHWTLLLGQVFQL